jgi:hypothetical protein
MHRKVSSLLAVLALACSLPIAGQKQSAINSCGHAAQSFYDWYVPLLASNTPASAHSTEIALRQQRYPFSSQLRSLLAADAKASARQPSEIVGLDFDPFTNSQDPGDPPGDPYVIGKIQLANNSCLVEMHDVSEGVPGASIAVTAELERRNGRWTFINFHYPEPPPQDNLKSILRTLAAARNQGR